MPFLNILSPGFLTTVQDLGRFRFAHFGVSASGAADPLALRIGNKLVGNPENSPALEMTLVGGEFEFEADAVMALTGSEFPSRLANKPLPFWKCLSARTGNKLSVGPSSSGARCYLSVQGGFALTETLGSFSTHVLTGLGGFRGRPLKKGDRLPVNPPQGFHPRDADPGIIKQLYSPRPLRMTPGPQADFFPKESIDRFLTSPFEVLEDSNRMGLRLRGPEISRTGNTEMVTEGVSLGAVQISSDGQPIILFVEHQTTGGYPKIANIVSADFHRVGQLRPRDHINFELVSFEEARLLLLEQESLLSKTIRTL